MLPTTTWRPEDFDLEAALKGQEFIREKFLDIRKRLNNKTTKSDVKPKEINALPIYEVMLEMFARGIKFKNVSITKSHSTHQPALMREI